jgi:hypothetical protein
MLYALLSQAILTKLTNYIIIWFCKCFNYQAGEGGEGGILVRAHEANIRCGGKTVHVVFKYRSITCEERGWGRAE